ncbi:hypothetical protein QCA50_006096 [Cerrena zonata]|uniref:Uncharacterized protein n=1 Tax=Cerrena zonata TaxID=2478898 RepID=A0AAW0GLA2_9APHY
MGLYSTSSHSSNESQLKILSTPSKLLILQSIHSIPSISPLICHADVSKSPLLTVENQYSTCNAHIAVYKYRQLPRGPELGVIASWIDADYQHD